MSVNVINNGGMVDPSVKFIGTGVVTIGRNAEIRANSIIEMSNGEMIIGEGSVIGYFSFIQCSGKLIIGNGSLLGPSVSYITSSHPINESPIRNQPLIRGEIYIGNNVWLGANVTIAYNTKIMDNSIVGANSFVNKDIPKNEIWGGVPAKKIKERI
jgi:acetyltransferase-like isoleucine patch superfamily enzyme